MFVSLVAVQVGNMNYLAGRQCSAWETAVSMVRMDEERQERDETDSSSQLSSIHPSLLPSHPPSLLCASFKILGLFAECRYKRITTLLAKNKEKRKKKKIRDYAITWEYRQYVDTMVLWFEESSLEVNIRETKELCCRGHRAPDTLHPLFGPLRLEGQVVEQVKFCKYLGAEINHYLSSIQHVDGIFKKAQQHMFCLKRMKGFNILIEYTELVLTFNIAFWYNFLTERKEPKQLIISQTKSKSPAPLNPNSLTFTVTYVRKADSLRSLHNLFTLPSGSCFRTPWDSELTNMISS